MDQRLYQIVHDFMADGEGELTVWAGDVVEVDADDQGEVSSWEERGVDGLRFLHRKISDPARVTPWNRAGTGGSLPRGTTRTAPTRRAWSRRLTASSGTRRAGALEGCRQGIL